MEMFNILSFNRIFIVQIKKLLKYALTKIPQKKILIPLPLPIPLIIP